jgi:hypothetical protein
VPDKPAEATEPDVQSQQRSIVVALWDHVFAALARVSLFWLVRRLIPASRSARFAEMWVLAHTVLAFAALVVAVNLPDSPLAKLLVGYGFLLIFEITVYQSNVLLFDWYRRRRARQPYAVQGILRMVLLLLHNYAEIVFWFAAAYEVIGTHSIAMPDRSIVGALYGSFQTMVSLGPGEVSYADSTGLLLIWVQSLVGLLLTVLVLARFVSLLPSVQSLDKAEAEPDGKST